MKLERYSVFIVFIILFASVLSPSMVNAKTNNINSTNGNPTSKSSFAYSTINITLDNNGITYERNTDLKAPAGWNLNFRVIYQKTTINSKVTELYHENLKLVANGSPLSYVSGTEGYQGDIYFTDHQPQLLGNFPRQDVNQTIVYKFILPSDQAIHLSYDSIFSGIQSSASFAKISGNTFTLTFNSGDLMPNYVSLTSDTPIFLQFSITDYAS